MEVLLPALDDRQREMIRVRLVCYINATGQTHHAIGKSCHCSRQAISGFVAGRRVGDAMIRRIIGRYPRLAEGLPITIHRR